MTVAHLLMLGAVIMQYVMKRIISCSFSRGVDGSRKVGFPRRDRNFFQWFGPEVYVFGCFRFFTMVCIWSSYIWSSWWGVCGVRLLVVVVGSVVLLIVLPGFKIACNLAVVPFRSFNVANMCEVMAGPGVTVGVGYCLMFYETVETVGWGPDCQGFILVGTIDFGRTKFIMYM